MYQFILLVGLILSGSLWATPKDKLTCFPENLQTYANRIILNSKTIHGYRSHPNLFFIHNISDIKIWLDHPSDQAESGWTSQLNPKNWSAILLTSKNFPLTCATFDKDKRIELDCSLTLFVCRSNILKNSALSGNYWYVENFSAEDFKRFIFGKLKTM